MMKNNQSKIKVGNKKSSLEKFVVFTKEGKYARIEKTSLDYTRIPFGLENIIETPYLYSFR